MAALLLASKCTALETASEQQEEDDILDLDYITYETMDVFMFQTFFDKLSSDFIPGLLAGISKLSIKEISGSQPLLDHDLVINYDLEDIHVVSASLDPTPPLLTINDGSVTFAVQNLNVNVTADYSYISEPPIFADIGEASFLFANTTFSVDVTSEIEPLTMGISNMKIDSLAEPFCSLDGISDFS